MIITSKYIEIMMIIAKILICRLLKMLVSGIQLVWLELRWGKYYEYFDFDQIVTHFSLFFCKLDNNPHQRDRLKRIHKQNECDCRAIQARNMARY